MKAELIKQAYAYGAAVALQELGFGARDAEAGGVKLAMAKMAEGEEEERDYPYIVKVPGGPEEEVENAPNAWAPTLFGPLGAAIAAPEGKKLRATGHTLGGQTLGQVGGGVLGGGVGAGLGALTGLLSRGKINPRQAALLGSYGGGYAGMTGGAMYGANKGYHHALDE